MCRLSWCASLFLNPRKLWDHYLLFCEESKGDFFTASHDQVVLHCQAFQVQCRHMCLISDCNIPEGGPLKFHGADDDGRAVTKLPPCKFLLLVSVIGQIQKDGFWDAKS